MFFKQKKVTRSLKTLRINLKMELKLSSDFKLMIYMRVDFKEEKGIELIH